MNALKKKSTYNAKKETKPYKKILFIYGDAGTGKSTFIQEKCYMNKDDKMYVLSMKDIIMFDFYRIFLL